MSLEQPKEEKPKLGLVDRFGNPIGKEVPQKEEKKETPVESKPIVDKHENPLPVEKKSEDKTPPSETDPYKGKTKEQIARDFNERIKNISFVDVGSLAEEEAIDAGDEKMTEKKGEAGFFAKIWKHNIMREYYRQKEIIAAKDKIQKSGNIYASEDLEKAHHDRAMDAITDRFTSEYSEVLRGDEKKKKLESNVEGVPQLKSSIQDVIKRYARGEINDTTFNEERNRLLSQVTGVSRDVIDNGSMYADNLKKVAEQAKMAMAHGIALEDLDFNFDITVGRARSGVKTEAQYNRVDKLVKSINSSALGSLIGNETTVALAIAGATSALTWGAERVTRTTSKILGGGLIGGAVASGAIIGLKENMRQKMERRQHLRDMAKGKSFEEGSVRREDFEKTRYETKAALDMTNKLLSEVYVDGDPKKGIKKFATKAEFDIALATMTEIEGRLELSSKEQIDLIAYSDVKNVEIENTRLSIEQARAKALIKKEMESNSALKQFVGTSTFDEVLSSTVATYEKSLLEGDLAKKDREFQTMKREAVAKAVIKGMATGLIAGVAFQEITAFFNPRVDGAVERLVHSGSSVHAGRTTALEGLREWWEGKSGIDPAEIAKNQVLNPTQIPGSPNDFIGLPNTAQMIDNHDGTFNILNNGKIVGNHIPLSLNPDGSPSPVMEDALAKAGLLKAGVDHHSIMTKTSASYTPEDFVEKFKDKMTEIKRDLWYDNDTKAPVFDKNELHTWWGGENNTGITADGKYVLNMSTMSGAGSYHEGFSTDAQELMKNGGVKLLLSMSRGTQNFVFEVPFDTHGNAIIDPHSEVGKLFFETVNGHAVFKGQFAEVAQMMGAGKDGVEHVRLLSTVVGHGIDAVKGDKVVPFDYDLHKYVFDQHRDWDIPPIIPILGRKPLESTVKKSNNPDDKPPVGPTGEVPPNTPTERVPGVPKTPETFSYIEKTISEKEYMAMQDDLKLINLKMQNHKGVLELEKNELKSDYARARYDELNFIRDGIPTQWNLEELKWLGDELEFILSSGKKIDRDPNEFLGKLRTNYELKQSYQSYVFELQNKGMKDVRGRARIIQSMHMILAQVEYLKSKRRGAQTKETFLKSSKEGGIGNMNVKSPEEYMAIYLSQLEDNIAKAESKYGAKSNWEEEYENALSEVHQIAIAKGKSFDEAEFEKAYKKGEVFAVRAKDGTILKTGIEGKKKEKVNVNGAQKIAEAKALLVEANKAFDEIIRNKDFTKKDPAFDWLVRIPTGKKVGGGLEGEEKDENSESLITDEVWEKFENEGRIPIEVIYDIAEKKYIYNAVLTEREQAMYDVIDDAWGNTTADDFNADLNKRIGENKTADTFITKEAWNKIFAGEKVPQDIIEKIAEKRKNKTPLSNHELFVFVLEIKKITDILKKEKNTKTLDTKKKPDSSKKKPDDEKKGPDAKKKKSTTGLVEFFGGIGETFRKQAIEDVKNGKLYTTRIEEAANIVAYPELLGEYEFYPTTDPRIGGGKIDVYKFRKTEEEPEAEENEDIDEDADSELDEEPGILEASESEPQEVDIAELLTYKRFSNEDVEKLIKIKKLYEADTTKDQLDEIKGDYERLEELLSHKENPMDEIDQFKSHYSKILIIEQQQNFGSRTEAKQAEQVRDQMSKLIQKFS